MRGSKKGGFVSLQSREVSARWGVSLRTAQAWLAAHPPVPVDDEKAMLAWVAAMPAATQKKLTRSFLRIIDETRTKLEQAAAGTFVLDPDYAAFEAAHAASTSDKDSLSTLKRQRDFALYKISRAQATGNLAHLKDATDQLRHISGVIHDEEYRAFKTGRELGDMVPVAEFQRILRAIPHGLLVGADIAITAISLRIAHSSGPLFPEEIRRLIEPILLPNLILGPAIRSAQAIAPAALSALAASALREGCAAVLESGGPAFDAAAKQTPNDKVSRRADNAHPTAERTQ